ncbi:MAG: nodulation protein NfeD [Bryobacteraceae bacterium]|nr:nodulation protein NfeD [Bryobacteraceae bacterium]
MVTMRRLFPAAALLCCGAALAQSRVVTVSLDGMIHPITVEIVGHALDQAQRENAKLVVVRLNTPGGLLDATRHIVEKIVASPVPVAAYVTPSGGRAASAGFFILQAADVAAMAPGTNTGAASPVLLGGKMDEVMRRKAENDASAALRAIVQKRSRNSELAEKAVLEAKAFTEKEALDNNLIDLIAASEAELVAGLDGREVTRFNGAKQALRLGAPELVDYEMTRREKLISAIADPNIAFILLVLGALGIYVEFSSPGLVAPGVAGGILVLLGLSALSVLPINWAGVALLLLAVTLFVLEAHFASHGILGVGGAVAMVLGALMLVEGPPEVRIRLSTAVAVTLPFAAITIFLLTLVLRARSAKVVTGSAGMVGKLGSAQTALNPSGKVFVHGEYWDAVSSTPVEAGARVEVTAVDGLTLDVRPAGPGSGARHD